MLRDDIAQYTELSGNDGLHTPIGIIGAYLDGYEKGKADTQPEQRWVPCSERLPWRSGYYLVTGRQGTVNKRLYLDGYWYGNWTVTAWMPLPKPWKGEDDADNSQI